jgi:hypothetical protein
MPTVRAFQAQPASPIIVKIIQPEPKSDLQGLSDVLLGSLGLTGLITIAALLFSGAGGRDVLDTITVRLELVSW